MRVTTPLLMLALTMITLSAKAQTCAEQVQFYCECEASEPKPLLVGSIHEQAKLNLKAVNFSAPKPNEGVFISELAKFESGHAIFEAHEDALGLCLVAMSKEPKCSLKI